MVDVLPFIAGTARLKPWIYEVDVLTIGNNEYRLILLDTNAIQEIVLNSYLSQKGFFEKFTHRYCPCISWHSLVELKPKKDIYQKAIVFFESVPSLLIMPYKTILIKEYRAYQTGRKFSFDTDTAFMLTKEFLESVFSKEYDISSGVEIELNTAISTVDTWKNQRSDDILPFNLFKQFEVQQIKRFLESFINLGNDTFSDVASFPAARLINFLQLCKVHGQKKALAINDLQDIMIAAVVPYVDAVITENNQASLFKQSKSFIPQMASLNIYTLKDIRLSN